MAIHVQCIHGVVAQAGRIAVVAPVMVKAACATIQQVETAAHRADPQVAEQVLDDGAGARIAERSGILTPIGVARHAAAGPLDARESAAESANPDIALSVLVKGHDAL